MSRSKTKQGMWVAALIASTLTAALTLVACFSRLGDALDLLSFDLPFAFHQDKRPLDVAVVHMDDLSYHDLKQSFSQPWDRHLHARLVDILTAEGAKAIVFDILFDGPQPENPGADETFAKAIQASGRVVLGADYLQEEPIPGQETTKVNLPFLPLRTAARSWGNVKLGYDPDLAVRRHFPNLANIATVGTLPSLAWSAASLAEAPVTRGSQDAEARKWMNYQGPTGTVPGISYHQVLLPGGVPKGFFRDKLVFIGSKLAADFSGRGGDAFATPYTRWGAGLSSGVEIHAVATQNLLRADWLRRPPFPVELTLLLLTAVGLGSGFVALRPLPALFTSLAVLLTVTVIACGLVWWTRWWFGWITILALQLPVALGASWVRSFFRWSVERSTLISSLEIHLPPGRVTEILNQPDLLRPGASKRTVTILFTDISNYSAIAESLVLEDLVKTVNDYFEMALGAIHDNDGTIIKLIGDAIFAVWHAPQDQPNHQQLACQSALRLRDQLLRFESGAHCLPMHTRAGLHTGEALVGNFGSSKRFDYTAMGESVNLASRLEGLNKHLGTDILASREFQQAIQGRFVDRPLGHFRLKGMGKAVQVHEIIGEESCRSETQAWRDRFESGLRKFKRREFPAAEAEFNGVLQLRPKDGPSKFYLAQIRKHTLSPPDENWTGEVDMDEK